MAEKQKYLVIVESPTKAKTISSILGDEYEVISSLGHVVDLPSRKLSVDVDDGFEPTYRIIPGKEKIVTLLKKKARKKQTVYLATDPDREGEAISWHIKNLLEQTGVSFSRVVFHEITDEAIREAFDNAGSLDDKKVEAQKVRRILDRLVGYFLSPFLWKKISRGLSAGRVQSVALRFIVDREKEIKQFIPKTTYEIEGNFNAAEITLKARLKKWQNNDAVFQKKSHAQEVIAGLMNKTYKVLTISRRTVKRKPPSPLTTSLLQQDAFNKLRFSSKKTMLVAQHLYEGLQIGDQMTGLITYMRTDSFNVSDKAKKEVKGFIAANFGDDFVADKEYKYKKRKSAQLAHESIRPTSVQRTPAKMKQYLQQDEYRLYELIWNRFVAAFMKEASVEYTTVSIGDEQALFSAEGKRIMFKGFLKVMGAEEETILPPLEEGEKVTPQQFEVIEKTTKPPPRYTDASLVKLLEEKGIGRPSTYVPIISTLIARNYLRKEKGYFVPTDLAFNVCSLLVDHFSDIVDENFTAYIEEKLDGIEEGTVDGKGILNKFYPPFKEKIDAATNTVKKQVEYVDKLCPQCNRQLIIKWSSKGRFLSCSGYPQCKYAESITTGVECPQCKEGKLIERRNKKGQRFYGCSKFPGCRYTSRALPE